MCNNPNLIKAVLDYTGTVRYIFVGPAKYTDPVEYGTVDDLSTKGYYYFLVPCGKCDGCRIDYSRTWAHRMILELKDNPTAMFVTLTYRDANLTILPSGEKTLVKRDVQLFFKRLRKAYPTKRIRFYLAGEYGPQTQRPHYHAIIYGLGLDDFDDLWLVGHNGRGEPLWSSPKFAGIWSHGNVTMSHVTYHTCAYVARYCLKKIHKDEYSPDVVPEFSLCSRRPGIGMLHAVDYVASGMSTFAVDGRDGVYNVAMPKAFLRYVKDHAAEVDKKVLDNLGTLVYNRSQQAYSRLCSRLLASETAYCHFLEASAKELGRKLAILPERM